MELLYLWIDNDYKTIDNQEFNFSNHVSFSFKIQNKKKGVLEIEENHNYLKDFFKAGERGIKNITAIIGKNGAGKTNLLNFVIDILTDRNPLKGDLIVAFKNKKAIQVFHTIQDFELSVSGSLQGYTVNEPILQEIKINALDFSKHPETFVNNSKLIFYNPAFDLRDYPANVDNEFKTYIDISTNALIENDVFHKGDSYPDEIKKVELYKYSNIRRQFEFIVNAHLANLNDVNLPDEVKIIFHRNHFYPNQNKKNLTSESEKIFNELDDLVIKEFAKVNRQLHKYQSNNNEEYQKALIKKLKVEFCYSFIHNYFNNLNAEYLEDIGIKSKEIKGTSLFEKAKYFFENQRWAGRGSSKYVQTANLFNSVIINIDEIDFYNQQVLDNANHFIAQVLNGQVILSNYINYMASLPLEYKINFLSTSWRNISSGENALMDLYSRLYFVKEYKLETDSDNDTADNPFLYILIDEGELGFHPQWQKEYLSNIINFVNQLFAEYDVQLILTSHSPFLVSDLPKENIILLNKEKETGRCKVVDQDILGQTFGANIHTLFKESFFLENGTMGEFAKEQIQDAILFLRYNPKKRPSKANKKPNKKWSKEEVECFIQIIGEPLIKERLQKLFDEKYHTKDDIEKRIALLQYELKKLSR